MPEMWCHVLQQIKFREQISKMLTLCQYMFSNLAHITNIEYIYSLMNI